MDLRDKMLVEINSALASVGVEKDWHWGFDDVAVIADRILAIPGLKRALERDNCPDCIRCGDCQDAPPLNLGHSIRVRDPD